MNRRELIAQIKKKRSFLCVGLDTDLEKIPPHLLALEDPIFEFNKQIIDHTKDFAVAYKPNIAFYEMLGPKGWESLRKTIAYIPDNIFTIADAKRGDIGNTSTYYARTFFDTYQFDSITIAPYMGSDSVKPFLRDDKWAIVLGLTSNSGALDFQNQVLENGKPLYKHVMESCSQWGTPENMMFVVGATRAAFISDLRKDIPEHFFLVPGVGAQGGSLEEVAKAGLTKDIGLLVNSSRAIIYASKDLDFAEKAGLAASQIQEEMAAILKENAII
jgi:orotidine-5'-phosphate decarboxylase